MSRPAISWGQYQQQDLYPGLQGQPLLDQLVMDFEPDTVFDYGDARDTLFARIDVQNDSLICVYSGHKVFLPPGVDPTQGVFMNGVDDGINTEHTWPQNFGAGAGPPRRNMHHLFPTRVAVNSARGNDPFGEINDAATEEWFYLNRRQTGIPNSAIDSYSEARNGRFEPREDHKGDVARAMFYFYTLYRTEADAADPTYFGQQRQTLCNWHFQDPVDRKEWNRTMGIAQYQGKANPFVLDCSLPERCYCEDVDLNCDPTSTEEAFPAAFELLPATPNPFTQQTELHYRLEQSAQVRLTVTNLLGQQWLLVDEAQGAGRYTVPWQAKPQATGLLFYRLEVAQGGRWEAVTQRMLQLSE
ncbi:MAG: endonuclease [Bacteroidota bacterium]